MRTHLLLITFFSVALTGAAQTDADRDLEFNVSGLGTPVFPVGGQYSKVTPLANGKVLVTGSLYSAASTTPSYSSILRLNSDGSFDNTFNPAGTGASGIISAVEILQNGKILIGGGFTSYNGTSFNGIARLNQDGSLDNTFNSGTGFSSILPPPWVRSFAIQSDGKIIVGGGFTSFDGTAIAGVCRLNADGSLDGTFNPGSGPNNVVEAVVIQSDGKILAGGLFGSFNSVSTGNLVRLNTDGSIDNSFSPGTSGNILRIVIQADGKVLTSGENFYRLESNGSLDLGFSNVTAGNSYNGLAIQQDGKIILSGFFTSYLSIPRERIVRLNTDGTVDEGFDSEYGFSTNPNHLSVQDDGKILVYGGFEYKGTENLVTRIIGTSGITSVINNHEQHSSGIIFPNPSNEFVTISNINTKSEITIRDLNGVVVYTTISSSEQESINTAKLKRGMYTVEIQHDNTKTVKRLILH